jgi:hypothetical protein
LSFALTDREFASQVLDNLTRAGLQVQQMDNLAPTGQYTDAVRTAIRRSDAVVVALSEVASGRSIPASVLFEIGAAAGAGKPIFVVVDNLAEKLPFNVPHLRVFPTNRIDEIPRLLESEST